MVGGLSQVLQAAVRVNEQILRKRPQGLGHVKIAREPGVRRADSRRLSNRRIDSLRQKVAKREELRRQVIRVTELRVKVGGMRPYVPNGQNQVRGYLPLHLQVPVLGHRGPAVGRVEELDCIVVVQRRINEGRQGKRREPTVNVERWIKAVRSRETRVSREAVLQAATEIGIDQRSVVNAIAAANHRLGGI